MKVLDLVDPVALLDLRGSIQGRDQPPLKIHPTAHGLVLVLDHEVQVPIHLLVMQPYKKEKVR